MFGCLTKSQISEPNPNNSIHGKTSQVKIENGLPASVFYNHVKGIVFFILFFDRKEKP